ncbi:hypothetical protein LSAT2_003097 [Lamellibrachia satsuma]|nr:hypothetical protein LSAT2_003097 [Lamellibrachia satsuma]
MSGAAVNLSRLSRGIGEVKTNGHERVNVVFESEDYFNYALQRPYLPPVEPLYQLNEPPELSPRLSLHPDVQHKNIALPKDIYNKERSLAAVQ